MKVKNYKGFSTLVTFEDDCQSFVGHIVLPNGDSVFFESKTENDIQKEFERAIDDYLDFLNKVGRNL